MNKNTKNATIVAFLTTVIGVSAATFSSISFTSAVLQAQDAQSAIARRLGVIKAIDGNTITLTPDSGPAIAVTIQPNARLLSIAPGEKDLKNATPIQLQDLHVGDRVRVRGTASADSASIAALEVIVIPSAVVAAVGEQMRQDWQKRGTGGLVSAVDPAAGTVTISISSLGGKKAVVVHTSKSTILHRYAPDSAKPEDAKPITLLDVHIGDQLRARGDRSADSGEMAAEEIYAGNFPNVDGLIKSIDASTGTVSVQDVVSKKTVQVKITADSQLHKIPTEMANRFAQRLKAALPPGTPGAGGNSSGPAEQMAHACLRRRRHRVARARAVQAPMGQGQLVSRRRPAEQAGRRAPVEDSTSSVCSTKLPPSPSLICTKGMLWPSSRRKARPPVGARSSNCSAEWNRFFRQLPAPARR